MEKLIACVQHEGIVTVVDGSHSFPFPASFAR